MVREITTGGFGPEGSKDKPEIDRGDLRQLLLDALSGHGAVGPQPDRAGICTGERPRPAIRQRRAARGGHRDWCRWCVVESARGLEYVPAGATGITFFEGWIAQPAADIAAMVGQGSLFCFGGEEALFVQRNSRDRLCVYAALKRSSEWLDAQIAQHGIRTLVTGCYTRWATNLRRLLEACTDFVRRPICSLPADFCWAPRDGVTLIGDAAHLMPPVGVGVNLAMLDASDVAMALCARPDAISAMRDAEVLVRERARALMPDAIEGSSAGSLPEGMLHAVDEASSLYAPATLGTAADSWRRAGSHMDFRLLWSGTGGHAGVRADWLNRPMLPCFPGLGSVV